MNRRGMTLLEVMVALVILGLVVGASLELFGGALRGAAGARAWSQAVVYAADAMEGAKTASVPLASRDSPERLPGGFERWLERDPWGDAGLTTVRVVVVLPGGGRYTLERLMGASTP